jgi:hypothetical protein
MQPVRLSRSIVAVAALSLLCSRPLLTQDSRGGSDSTGRGQVGQGAGNAGRGGPGGQAAREARRRWIRPSGEPRCRPARRRASSTTRQPPARRRASASSSPGQFGDTIKTVYDYADRWLSQKGRF